MNDKRTTYILARLPIGMSFLGHGLVRIPKIADFANGMAQSFTETILPGAFVTAFGFVLPFVELLLGIALISGFFMRKTAITGVALMGMLIFGSSLLENWSGVMTQMFYGAYFCVLYLFVDFNQPLFYKTN